MDNITKAHHQIPELPCPAIDLVPQRAPMLLIDQLVSREQQVNFAVIVASVPTAGVFMEQGQVVPEYFVELVAQAMAAVNGYDNRVDGTPSGRGFLVGIDDFSWYDIAEPGERLRIELQKNFEFGPVTVMAGQVLNEAGDVLASGEIKVWEEK